MGALAFMAAGHAPGRGKYGSEVQKALDFVVDNARPSGLLNISNTQRDMYNHGLATLVLGQAHGMSTRRDQRLNATLDHALRLITLTQCDDGGWGYQAQTKARGHDLSLAVMQAVYQRLKSNSARVKNPVRDRLSEMGQPQHAPQLIEQDRCVRAACDVRKDLHTRGHRIQHCIHAAHLTRARCVGEAGARGAVLRLQ